jgi:membrane-bound ClpP family serine protease
MSKTKIYIVGTILILLGLSGFLIEEPKDVLAGSGVSIGGSAFLFLIHYLLSTTIVSFIFIILGLIVLFKALINKEK